MHLASYPRNTSCVYLLPPTSSLTRSAQEPQGYSDTFSGVLGATLLFSGILASIVTAPLFDRVFTHHMGVTLKVLVPIVAGAWLGLIWAGECSSLHYLFARSRKCFEDRTSRSQ